MVFSVRLRFSLSRQCVCEGGGGGGGGGLRSIPVSEPLVFFHKHISHTNITVNKNVLSYWLMN